MAFKSMVQRAGQWVVVAALWGAGFAMAQAEPTLAEVYSTAQSGHLDKAQTMIQQVLVAHPNSAKAHFVRAELYSRQGELGQARKELAAADKLAPGLPFAQAASVQTLRSQLSTGSSTSLAASGSVLHPTASLAPNAPASWGLPLLLAGGLVIALGYLAFRKRAPQPFSQSTPQPGAYSPATGFNNAQAFGMASPGSGAAMQPNVPQPAYAQPTAPPPASSGLGGQIAGGLATGLAVGAGVMAAQAIGRNLMGHANQPTPPTPPHDNFSTFDQPTLPRNTDMGGQDFGINDASSWDSDGDVGGGSDWDS